MCVQVLVVANLFPSGIFQVFQNDGIRGFMIIVSPDGVHMLVSIHTLHMNQIQHGKQRLLTIGSQGRALFRHLFGRHAMRLVAGKCAYKSLSIDQKIGCTVKHHQGHLLLKVCVHDRILICHVQTHSFTSPACNPICNQPRTHRAWCELKVL